MVCSAKVGSVVELEESQCIHVSVVCNAKKIAEFCLSKDEYETLGEPKPGDAVDYGIVTTTYSDGTSMRKLEVRFLGRPVRV